MDALTDRRHVEPDERAAPFPDVAGDEHRLDVTSMGVLHHGRHRVGQRHGVDVFGTDNDEVGLLAGRQASGLGGERRILGARRIVANSSMSRTDSSAGGFGSFCARAMCAVQR